jgi:histidinol-phosphatase (PHP family)
VQIALDKGLKVIGFAEHGPLHFDPEKRLTEPETYIYLKDAHSLKRKYASKIKILCGLEMDYIPSEKDYLRKIIPNFNCDFVLGSIHFIEKGKDRISIWDYPALQDETVWKQYFKQMNELISSGVYTGVAHPDMILRSGLPNAPLAQYFINAIQECKFNNMTYEINCAGITKSSYDPSNKIKITGKRTYPDINLAQIAYQQGVCLTIGSDAHEPEKLAENVGSVIQMLLERDIARLYFVESKTKFSFQISSLDPLDKK